MNVCMYACIHVSEVGKSGSNWEIVPFRSCVRCETVCVRGTMLPPALGGGSSESSPAYRVVSCRVVPCRAYPYLALIASRCLINNQSYTILQSFSFLRCFSLLPAVLPLLPSAFWLNKGKSMRLDTGFVRYRLSVC